jgi:CRP-like cAMP-binding protein
MEEFVFQNEDEIITQGEVGDCMYLLNFGRVQVIVDGSPVAELESGTLFGEMALLSSHVAAGQRTATIEAKQTCVCWVINREGLMNVVKTFPRDEDILKAEADRRMQDLKRKGLIPDKANERRLLALPQECSERRASYMTKLKAMKILSDTRRSSTAKRGSRRASANPQSSAPPSVFDEDPSLPFSEESDGAEKDNRVATEPTLRLPKQGRPDKRMSTAPAFAFHGTQSLPIRLPTELVVEPDSSAADRFSEPESTNCSVSQDDEHRSMQYRLLVSSIPSVILPNFTVQTDGTVVPLDKKSNPARMTRKERRKAWDLGRTKDVAKARYSAADFLASRGQLFNRAPSCQETRAASMHRASRAVSK